MQGAGFGVVWLQTSRQDPAGASKRAEAFSEGGQAGAARLTARPQLARPAQVGRAQHARVRQAAASTPAPCMASPGGAGTDGDLNRCGKPGKLARTLRGQLRRDWHGRRDLEERRDQAGGVAGL